MPKMSPKASIIIRTKNEERWISHCLKEVFRQTEQSFEVIIVDNDSTDNTKELAQRYPIKMVEISEYTPGLALNKGIREASGEYIVCLSAHCLPRNDKWLENLLRNFNTEENAGGVYGRQIPVKYSSANDKRDLMITFGLDRRVQVKDSFFHNANSALPRSLWEKVPFDETLSNIEDRYWAREVTSHGYTLVYEPEAEVYHHHGIHHDRAEQRSQHTIRILEDMHVEDMRDLPRTLRPEHAHVVAFVLSIGQPQVIAETNLQNRAVRELQQCEYIDAVCMVSDNDEVLAESESIGATAIPRRGELISSQGASVETSLKYALQKYEESGETADAVVFVNPAYPFRPSNYFHDLIEKLLSTGVDTTLVAQANYGVYWMKDQDDFKMLGGDLRPRIEKDPIYHGVWGMGGASMAHVARGGHLIGERVNLVEQDDSRYAIRADRSFSEKVIKVLLEEE